MAPLDPSARPGPGRDRDGRGARRGAPWSSRWWRCWSSPRSSGRSASGCRACASSSVERRSARRSVRPRASTRVARRPPGSPEPRWRSATGSSWPTSTLEPGSTSRWPADASIGPPDAAYVDAGKGGAVSLVWAATASLPATVEPGVGLVLTQFRGTVDEGFFRRCSAGTRRSSPCGSATGQGYWLSGDPHFLFWKGPDGVVTEERRWVGDALLWSDGDITFRLESALGRDAAIRLADRCTEGSRGRLGPREREPRLPARCKRGARSDANGVPSPELETRCRRPPACADRSSA